MFMIFGNHAINMDLVTRLSEEVSQGALGVASVRIHMVAGSLVVDGVTIDQILTAQAAGQARVAATPQRSPVLRPESDDPRHDDEALRQSLHFDDGSKRGIARGNDPQAMKAIGRQR